ncbi:MAG: hypothetical protein M1820_007998 [Bogoriella megaspora]|nr:MAG: hypothetical protein M1820_007998 [Bogoriella megaspora]
MSLFNSSLSSEPVLQIELDQPSQYLYYPGSKVSGRIVLQSQVEEFIKSVNITLQGHNDTYAMYEDGSVNSLTSTIYHYRDQTPLFVFYQTLFSGNKKCLRNQNNTWSFSFDNFPSLSDNDKTFRYHRATDGTGAWLSRRHPLPPSYNRETSTRRYCAIRYSIEAHVHCAPGRNYSDLSSVRPIRFVPFRTDRSSPPPIRETSRDFELPASRLLPEKRSLKTKFHDAFSSGAMKYRITLRTNIPSEIAPGRPFGMSCALQIHAPDETDIPPIQFEIKRLRLRTVTMSRGVRLFSDGETTYRETGYRNERSEYFQDGIDFRCEPSSGQAIKEKGQMIWSFPTRVMVPNSICPTFQSFSISLGHRFEFDVGVEIGGKKYELKEEPSNFTVVSPFGNEESRERSGIDQLPLLPAYEAVGESSRSSNIADGMEIMELGQADRKIS